MTVFPNPAKEMLNVKFNSSAEGLFSFKVFDMIGKNVSNTVQKGIKGMNTFELNLSELNRGIYFIEVSNNAEREIKKIILN